MKLWLLECIVDWPNPWDCNMGFVIRADSEYAARVLAESVTGDEPLGAWLDGTQTTCEELTADGGTDIVLRDFHAG